MAINDDGNCVVVGTALPAPDPRQDTDADFLKHRVHGWRMEFSNRRKY